MNKNKFFKGCGYRAPLNFHDNLIINILIDSIINILRGIGHTVDGLILIFSLGRCYTSFSFKSTMLIFKMNRGKKCDDGKLEWEE